MLFDNVKEPIITTVADTIAGWSKGTYVHQVLAPGVDVREVPEGRALVNPYQGCPGQQAAAPFLQHA